MTGTKGEQYLLLWKLFLKKMGCETNMKALNVDTIWREFKWWEEKKKECLISPIWCMTQREQHKQTEKTNRWSDRYAGARPWWQWQQSVVILKSCELELAASEAWGGWVQHGLCFACGRHSEWHYSEPFEVFQLVVKKIDDSKAITTQ